MPQLVARISASESDVSLTLMSLGKEESGSERKLVNDLVNAAASDKSLPVRKVSLASREGSASERKA